RVLFQSPGVSALLARGTKLFNGDCVAATSATRCRLLVQKSHSVPPPRPKNVACSPRTGGISWLYRQPQGQGGHVMKSVARLAFLAAAGLLASIAVAQADTFTFTSDHCTGGCNPSGTVTATASGNNLNISVTLGDSLAFLSGNGAGIEGSFA